MKEEIPPTPSNGVPDNLWFRFSLNLLTLQGNLSSLNLSSLNLSSVQKIPTYNLQPSTSIWSNTSCISPKSEPSLKPIEAGTCAKTSSDTHTTQSVQPQGLTFQRKADEKKIELSKYFTILYLLCYKFCFHLLLTTFYEGAWVRLRFHSNRLKGDKWPNPI